MSQQQKLVIFIATLIAGVVCLVLKHETIGGALITGAIGLAAPSPFAKPAEGEGQ